MGGPPPQEHSAASAGRGFAAGGPPPPAALDATLAWVTETFGRYYAQNPPPLPSRFVRREFGFIWNGKKFFLRHTGFTAKENFERFMAREAPHHAYYSTAYYDKPHAPTMAEKTWRGADLIFDLDADHLPGGDKLSFAQQLAAVKVQARKLLDDFLLGDFGFKPEHIKIVFSGGRGYHFHVTDPRVLSLDSAARREIVDYLSPNETVAAHLAEKYLKKKAGFKDNFGTQRDHIIPPASTPGWEGLITRTIIRTLEEIAATKAFPRKIPGVGATTQQAIIEAATPEKIQRLRDTGMLLTIPPLNNAKVIAGFVQDARVVAEGETDEPVTADIKRLIRLPGSLHGKTGLRVTPLTIEEFHRFDPLLDAVALGDAPTRIVVSKPIEVSLKGVTVMVQPGEQELPLHQAAFVILRRAGLRPYSPAVVTV